MAVENITKPRKQKKHKKSPLRILINVILILMLIVALYVGFVTFKAFITLPEWNSIEQSSNSVIYDDEGNEMVKLHRGENRSPVKLDDMPQDLLDGFISTEDTRFYDHFGVDIKRIAGAALVDIKSGKIKQGASTITMQLARNAILESQEQELERKIKEAFLAIKIEQHYTKDEILEMYLNAIYFGHGAYGVQEAARVYFDKDVSDLTLDECAILVGVVRNPKVYSPRNSPDNSEKVRNTVLDNMARYEYITTEEAESAKAKPIKTKDGRLDDSSFNWLTDYIIDEAEDTLVKLGYDSSQLYTGGFRVYSTGSPSIQDSCEKTYAKSSLFPKSNTSDPVQSAMVIMESNTGAIKGIIGGREYKTRRGFNRASDMKRQPGSVIKPISVYGAALEEGYGPTYQINNKITTFGGNYTPKNYDGKYSNTISMTNALRISANIPAVSMLDSIGVEKGFNFAVSAGLPLVKTDKNLSLALGGLTYGVSPVDLAGSYGAYANQGNYNEPYVIDKITDLKGNVIYQHKSIGKRIMSEQTAYAMCDMLKNVVTSGTGTKARMNRPVAGKTGTTQLPDRPEFNNITGNKDAWWAGYTTNYVGIVWMGYDNDYSKEKEAQYLTKVYGGQYPATIWKQVMQDIHKGLPVTDFKKPDNYEFKKVGEVETVSVTICAESGLLATEYCPSTRVEKYDKESTKIPTEKCNIHGQNINNEGNTGEEKPVEIMLNICDESGDIANSRCPSYHKNKYLSTDPNIPTQGCTVHGKSSGASTQ